MLAIRSMCVLAIQNVQAKWPYRLLLKIMVHIVADVDVITTTKNDSASNVEHFSSLLMKEQVYSKAK
jgi:hypothetical protein